MTDYKLNSLGGKVRMLGASLALIAALGYPASASAIVFDGLLDRTGALDNYDTVTSVGWYNDHHSIYTKANAGVSGIEYTPPGGGVSQFYDQVATMAYTVGTNTLNVFVEVPDYARRLIWKDGFSYKAGDCDAPSCTGINGIDKDTLNAYLLGARDQHEPDNKPHHKDVKFDYKTQTGSEYFQLNETGVKIKWQAESGPIAANGGTLDWMTSREYHISNTAGCSAVECILVDSTSSIELAWTGLTDPQALLDSFTEFQLHLSDEMRLFAGPPSEVPVPAAIWLFGTALIGFIGFSRRTNLS